eukprot:3738002-Rhodomonas_salina.2
MTLDKAIKYVKSKKSESSIPKPNPNALPRQIRTESGVQSTVLGFVSTSSSVLKPTASLFRLGIARLRIF